MKPFLLAALTLLATPSPARAEASLSMREVTLGGGRTLAGAAPAPFQLVGLHWRGPGTVAFRTRSPGGRWSAWRAAAPEAEDLPDETAREATEARGWRIGNPYWVGSADAIRYRIRGRVTRLRAYFVRSPADALPLRRVAMAGSPAIVPRPGWRANEAIRRAAPRYAPAVSFAVVHHTAGSNSYSRAQSPAIVRAIQLYHVKGNGWDDVGYNFLVDRYGQVFEGRYGGIDKNVIGAHAQGFNAGSVGVAVLGTYGSAAPPPAALSALNVLLAWRLDVAHVDPLSTLTWRSGGNPRFAAGVPVFLRAISGHRDTGFTTCPGNALYARLGGMAATVATLGLPKLYAPSATGDVGGLVRFRARLSEVRPWTVSVTDPAGAVVASASGTSAAVDWSWDAAAAPKARYAWTISAGDGIRPATGFVGTAPVPLTLTKVSAQPGTISPNGDGVADSTTIAYTISASATVTAVLRAAAGTQLAVLFSDRRPPGRHTFRFAADGLPDGRYEIVLTATDARSTVTATVRVVVDRSVSSVLRL